MTGLTLLLTIIGVAVLWGAWRVAVWVDEAPTLPGEYSHLDELDGLPRDVVAHEERMNARAERVGMNR